jgi:hypothetical protein
MSVAVVGPSTGQLPYVRDEPLYEVVKSYAH